MKRTALYGSLLSLGLLVTSAQAQQNNNQQQTQPNNQQQFQPQTTQPTNPAATQNQNPNTNPQVQPQNTQVNQIPNQNSQPNVNAQPGTAGAAVGAQANTAQTSGTMVNGRVVRTGQDQFVVQGADNQQYTFYTNPQTSYWLNNNPAQFSNLQVGSSVSTWYVPQGNRYFVNRVNLLPAGGAVPAPETTTTNAQPVQPVPVPAGQNSYQGEVVRVAGNQVVIKTADGKEVIVYTNPQTTYQLNEQPATYTQLQPGVPVNVNYYMQDGRPYARGILGRLRNR